MRDSTSKITAFSLSCPKCGGTTFYCFLVSYPVVYQRKKSDRKRGHKRGEYYVRKQADIRFACRRAFSLVGCGWQGKREELVRLKDA